MCMLFLFMIYYKCIFIRFHEDKYSMDFFKKKNIKKLKIINNKTINIIYAVLLFIKMNLTDEKSVQTVDKVPVFAGTFTMSTVFLV